MQGIENRCGLLLPDFQSLIRLQLFDLSLKLVEQADLLQGVVSQLTLIDGMQVKELAPGMGHAGDFGHALLEALLVAGKVVTHQLALPGLQKGPGMFARAIRRKVIDHALNR